MRRSRKKWSLSHFLKIFGIFLGFLSHRFNNLEDEKSKATYLIDKNDQIFDADGFDQLQVFSGLGHGTVGGGDDEDGTV